VSFNFAPSSDREKADAAPEFSAESAAEAETEAESEDSAADYFPPHLAAAARRAAHAEAETAIAPRPRIETEPRLETEQTKLADDFADFPSASFSDADYPAPPAVRPHYAEAEAAAKYSRPAMAEGKAETATPAPARPFAGDFKTALERGLINELFGEAVGKTAKSGREAAEAAALADSPKAAQQRKQPQAIFIPAEDKNAIRYNQRSSAEAARPAAEEESLRSEAEAVRNEAERRRAAEKAAARAEAAAPAPADDASYRAKPASRASRAKLSGYTGDMCPECHNYTMLRNGDFLKCDICGATIRLKQGKNA